jgi:predicted phage-related endonuclease
MSAKYHDEIVQGSDEWLAVRRGIITASEMGLLLTPTLKVAANDKSRAHIYELAAQRISGFTEPHYIGSDMLRGQEDEILARALYAEKIAPVTECGFVTNDEWGFTLGYSPDGLVGSDGLIECKSRRQKYHVQTIAEHKPAGTIPDEYVMQVQTGLLVTGRKWLDFISYSGGLPMCVIRVYPDLRIQAAILDAARTAEAEIAARLAKYHTAAIGLLPTERRIEEEMYA